MFVRLFLLFTLVPLVELALLIKIGSLIGTLDTIIIIVFTGVVGTLAVRAAGIQCLIRVQSELRSGSFPADEMFNGILILLAGALLIIPGLITDTVGFLLLVPLPRKVMKQWLKRYVKTKLQNSKSDPHIHIHFE
jgi:UPF0716 protein FxsA